MCDQLVRPSFVSGWPPKEYFFTGEWAEMPRASSRRIAQRNNPTVYYPVYEAQDGTRIVDATATMTLKPITQEAARV